MQHYDQYTTTDHEVWNTLFERQMDQLYDYACPEYVECVNELSDVFHADAIPVLSDLSDAIQDKSGWTITIVPGLIPADRFLFLLSKKIFCSSTWLRKKEQLDYIEEPDMFHDVFGHIPLLIHPVYSRFMRELGELAGQWNHPDHIKLLERLYWYTIEFGLIEHKEQRQIYGSGIVSSYGETKKVMLDSTAVSPFKLEDVLESGFRKDIMQDQYFTLSALDDLREIIPQLEHWFRTADPRVQAAHY